MIKTTARKYIDPLFELENKLQDLIVGVAADYADCDPGITITVNLLKAKKLLGKANEQLCKEEQEEQEIEAVRPYLEAKKRAERLQNEPTTVSEPASLRDTTRAHTPAMTAAKSIAVQAETTGKAAPAPAPTPEKEVTPTPAKDGEKAEKKVAPKVTPPTPKAKEQTAPKAEGWIEKAKTDDKLNSASQENYADKSDADLDKERRFLCRDAVVKGAQPSAVRDFTSEKFGVRTVGAIPREKHGEWVRAFKETFGV